MVFGIGEGKIEIRVNKLNFKPGDTISGTVWLKVNQPKPARGVRIEFFGERQVRTGKNLRTEKVYSFIANLDSEHEYSGEREYPFEIRIPPNLSFSMPSDTLGTIMNVASFLGGITPPRWYLKASLDIPLGIDISKQVQLSIQ